eukprot:TRINITY_DN19884_c0_g1_i1.p1 TRINITY_DN19884_c0_g1~~TRINITY_DN19884_c0_g1_i1.p1  ORF type:complete len:222 (+),score=31.43 TRINITY_DN19884_c0_g1_i1:87-668(+)
MARSLSVLSLPPEKYGKPKGALWAGSGSLNRFPAQYAPQEDVFEEYLDNKSLKANKHMQALMNSSGLLELHYDTMRKRQKERAARPAFVHGPTMDRMYAAAANYGGHIPGKISNNVVGCSWQHGSKVAYEVRGKTFDPPMSGLTYTFPNGFNPSRSSSSASLGGGGSGTTPPRTPPRSTSVPALNMDLASPQG